MILLSFPCPGRLSGALSLAVLLGLSFAGQSRLLAQTRPAQVAGQPASKPQSQPGASPNQSQPQRGKPEDSQKPEDDAQAKSKDATAEAPEPKVIRRDEAVDGDADPEELNVSVGDDGRVAFQFRNQPWIDLVQWLADISDQPLDWQELPGDRVNMRSPGRYTVEETRDLFNRYLLARGYTLLQVDGGLTVAKTENINPAIVQRVTEEELQSLQPHTFVRASLDVGWLPAEKLAEELKPMVSSNGRLTALTTTNRIEAMDAAINLRQIAQLLQQERNRDSMEALAPEMKLRYLPAEDAKRMLEEFLGVKEEKATPMTPQQIQMMQQRMRTQQPNATPPAKEPEIAIVANPRQNSVIIRAPADRVAIAMEFLKRVDVPSESMMSLADIQTRIQVFRLSTLDPEKLIEMLGEMNILEPTTRISVDKENTAVIVNGSAADRYIVDQLIERLDGNGRKLEVLPLRRLDPVEVAESIAFLMGKDEEDDQDSGRRSYYYGFYGSQQEEKKPKDEFRVSANTRNRQVLLWANEREMEEVRSLLVKLGELPPPGGSKRSVRVIDASATPETYEYLKQLQRQWNRLSPNPLELPDQQQFKEPNLIPPRDDDATPNDDSEIDSEPVDEGEELPGTKSARDDELAEARRERHYQFTNAGPAIEAENASQAISGTPDAVARAAAGNGDASDEATATAPEQIANAEEQTSEQQGQALPPIRSSQDFDRVFGTNKPAADEASASEGPPQSIRIEVDSAGNLVLVSPDTAALDRLENLMLQMSPPRRPYHVFHIEHASASWMRLNLEDYYADLDESGDSDSDSFYRWYWGRGDDQSDDEPSGLGKGVKLRFVDDPDTNTLVVSGATPEQLRTISELIELWDVPEPVNKRKARFTKLVPIRYGKADKISDTVKEAYRDLLSSNDKAFVRGGQNGGGGGGNNQAAKSRQGNGSSLQDSESGRDGGSTDFSFKGKLSLGVDTVGNTLLVSAEGEPLLELVVEMIGQLDEAARPTGEVQVIQLPGGLSGRTLQEALSPIGLGGSSNGTGNERPMRRDRNGRETSGNTKSSAPEAAANSQP